MFSILEKGQDIVNVEDLEALQHEIEKMLVSSVTQKWKLERELLSLNSSSPDQNSDHSNSTIIPQTLGSNSPCITGKLRNSISHRNHNVDISENSTDTLLTSSDATNNNDKYMHNDHLIREDSVGSEASLNSNQTDSTIILTSSLDLNHGSNSNSNILLRKRSHKGGDIRPSKKFRLNNNVPQPNPMILPARNEAPDKFWPFIEQFCSTPTEEQIQNLEEMIKDMEEDKEYFKVPLLGKKCLTPTASAKKSTGKPVIQSNDDNNRSLMTPSRHVVDEEAGLGALTQRLVSCLIEEGSNEEELDQDGSKKKNSKGKGKKNDMNNAKTLESRIRRELEEYQIQNQHGDAPYENEEDEILVELRAHQDELALIQAWNKESMRHLAESAKKHRKLIDVRKELEEANTDVIASYVRLIHAKQKKRNPTKKEKDAAWKALEVQREIYNKCEDLNISSN